MSHSITGLVSAPFTPLRSDGSLHIDRVYEMVDRLLENEIKGIFVCGSTGEGPSLTTPERKQVAEAFVGAVHKRIPVFVHVGHNSIAESRELAAHAQEIGADYISATPPTYFKIASVEVLVDCLSQIAAAAPELPLYYYNIPALTGIQLDMIRLLELGQTALPGLAGIKYTAPTLHDYQACLNFARGRYDLLYGTDEMLLSALATGAKGFIGSTYNFAAPLYDRLIRAFYRHDLEEARQCQWQAVEMVRLIVRYGGLPAQKAIMKMIGTDCGPVRLPLRTLSPEDYRAFEKDLEKIGFFEWCSVSKRASFSREKK